jgi:hypothetical protein
MEFTAAGVVWALLEGALSYVGGQMLSKALGGATITDVHVWIQQAVLELESFIAAKLDEKVLEQIQTNVSGLQTDMNQYARLQPSHQKDGKFLLEHVDTDSAQLIPLTYDYQQALFLGFLAIGYRFFATMSLYRLVGDAAFITADKQLVDDFIVKMNQTYLAIFNRLSPASRIRIDCWMELPPNGEIGSYSCDVKLDGTELNDALWWTDSEDQEGSVRGSAQAYADSKVKPGVLVIQQNFQSAALKCFHGTIDTYTKMCKLVGITYKSPVDFPPTPVAAPKLGGVPIFMPGAVIINAN